MYLESGIPLPVSPKSAVVEMLDDCEDNSKLKRDRQSPLTQLMSQKGRWPQVVLVCAVLALLCVVNGAPSWYWEALHYER